MPTLRGVIRISGGNIYKMGSQEAVVGGVLGRGRGVEQLSCFGIRPVLVRLGSVDLLCLPRASR